MTVFDDLDKVKNQDLPQILVVFGEAKDLVDTVRDQILDFIDFDPSHLSQSYFDLTGAGTNIQLALEDLESLPFLDDRRVIILENLTNLTAVKKKILTEGQMQQFEKFLDQPIESNQLVLICQGKLDSRLKVVKKLKKVATLLEAKELSPRDLLKIFSGRLPSLFLEKIFQKSNFIYGVIKQNIELVETYANGREISLADLDQIIPKSLQENIFDLAGLVLNGQSRSAVDLFHDLTLQGEDGIKILTILTNTFRLYYQVKLLQFKAWGEQEQAQYLKIHPYRIKLANQTVKLQSKTSLGKALSRLIKTDFQIKKGRGDKNYLMEITLIHLSEELAQ